jgi:hypothetical protein
MYEASYHNLPLLLHTICREILKGSIYDLKKYACVQKLGKQVLQGLALRPFDTAVLSYPLMGYS